jgi:hypothetical protein
MIDVWVKPNGRVLKRAMVLPATLLVAGLWLVGWTSEGHTGMVGAVLGGVAIVVGLVPLALLVVHLRRPRIGFREGQVLFYLRSGPPIATPLDVVEAFFLGQGPAMLPGAPPEEQETVNLIARIAERAESWQHVEVKRQLGHWCDGYAIVRGTWCEPLDEQFVRRLNHRLAQAKRDANGKAET